MEVFPKPFFNIFLQNVKEKDEYDYGQSTPGRTTKIQYQPYSSRSAYTFPPPINNEPCQTVTYDGSGNRIAETDFYYDGGTTLCGAPGTPSVANVSGPPSLAERMTTPTSV